MVFRSLGIAFGLVILLAPAEARAEDDADDVTVSGTRLVETGGSAHVVKDAQLRRFSYDDPHQVLLSVPGVYVRPEDGMGLRPNIGIRGANSDRSKKVTLMEDGVLVGPAPYSAPAAYYFPLIDRMRTVRVVKGPGSILFGPQTVGGAIDLVTREIPTERKGTYDFAAGQYGFNKQHVTYGASDEHAGFLIEGMRLDNSGFKDLDSGGSTGFTRNEWMGKASYNPDPRADVQNEFLLKLGYSDEGSDETYLGLTDADLRATPDRRYRASREDRMDNHRTAIELTHKLRFSPQIDVTTTAYRHDFHRIWRKVNGIRGEDITDVLAHPETPRNAVFRAELTGEADSSDPAHAILIGPNNRQFVSQGVQTQVRVAARTGPIAHHVTYGVRAHYDEIVRKHTQDGFLMRGGELVPDGRVTEVTADNKAMTHALAMWVVDAVTIGPVTVTPGVRIEAIHAAYRDNLTRTHDGATYQVVIPGASAYWALRRDFGILAGVHKGFSPVPPEQARTAPPEESVNYEAGVRFARRNARAEVIAFYNDYSNLTDICTFSSGCDQANLDQQFGGGRARIAGAEVFGETELKLPDGFILPARVAYTYTYTELSSSFASADPQFGQVKRGDELPYVPAHQVSASVGVEKKQVGLNVSGTFVDSMWEHAGHGTAKPGDKTDAYFLLDASAKYRVIEHVELYVNGRNLTNDRYIASRRPFGARPGAPLWVIAGVRGEF
ncbi:MAG: ligand-gated channel protein [Labilithrix sp.]|nr:ligand-gated channel protein [Labilithrix sp.]